MELLSLTLSIVFPLSLVSLAWLSHRERMALLRSSSEERNRLAEVLTASSQKALEASLAANREAQQLLASKDPLAYQQIAAMTMPAGYDVAQYTAYDPSDEAEMERIAARDPRLMAEDPEDDPDAVRRALAELTGIDPDQPY